MWTRWGQIPRSGLNSGNQSASHAATVERARIEQQRRSAVRAAELKRERERQQIQYQANAIRAQRESESQQQQEIIDKVYSHFPLPIRSYNRIVGNKIYNLNNSNLWIDVTTGTTKNGSKLEVKQVGRISIGCAVFKSFYDDGGKYGVYRKLGDEYVKENIDI